MWVNVGECGCASSSLILTFKHSNCRCVEHNNNDIMHDIQKKHVIILAPYTEIISSPTHRR